MKKKLPTVFVCPRCGEEAVRVTIAKDTGHATVLCALCNLKDDFPAHPAAQPIDVYSYFTDRFYGVKDPRAIIPHDREIQFTPPAEEAQQEEATPELKPDQPEIETPSLHEPPQTETATSEDLQPQSVSTTAEVEPTTSTETNSTVESVKEAEEDSEPFADILENKDKKRYSATPIPQQSSEQTS